MRKSSKKNQAITRMRLKAGLTQSELAQLVEVSENTIANWERGSASKWISHLIRLCKALNCTLEDLDPEADIRRFEVYELLEKDIETVRSYCEAILHKDYKASSKIASYATIHDDQLRYWLDQADKLMHDFQEHKLDAPDPETLVSGLTLCNLMNRLSYCQPNKLKIDKFGEYVSDVKLDSDFLRKYVALDHETYKRSLIFQTWTLAVYVIGWQPGQEVPMHHHGNSLDAIKVVQGEMTHWQLSDKEAHHQNIPFEGIEGWWEEENFEAEPTRYRVGELILVDRRTAHKIKNFSDRKLITLHFRFGAPPDDDRWNPEGWTFICDPIGQCHLKQPQPKLSGLSTQN